MVPIHESDLAEERWAKVEWQNYELWEKVEGGLRRRRRLWILGTLVTFLSLSAVPIVMERGPKWRSRTATRRISQVLNEMKREASVARKAYRFRFLEAGKFDYVIESLESCRVPASPVQASQEVRRGEIPQDWVLKDLTWLPSARAEEFKIPGVVSQFCYDSHEGSELNLPEDQVKGFAVLPVNDLAEGRVDRISVLLLTGPSAEVSFD